METTNDTTRRRFLLATGATAGSLLLGHAPGLFAQAKPVEKVEGQEVEVSPAEDLMREHGALRRILLIYREWIQRMVKSRTDQIDTLAESSQIVRSFVEQYHEKLEEEYLFPRFKKKDKLVDLVDVLLQQHQAGRRVTDETLRLSNAKAVQNSGNRRRLIRSLHQFIRMYEPHAAREDTVLFPAFHQMLPGKEYDELGDLFENKENELFGERGFEKTVDRIAAIEKKLGIYDLARFTPKV
jgi:hemerythrin-like domain-containing protein